MSELQTIFVDENELKPYPEKDVSDYMRSPIDAAASSVIPFGDKILASVLGNSLSKRRDDWLKALAEKVQELLRKKYLTVKDLQDNDRFIDTVFQATQIAIKTSQKEKHEALKNAIINTSFDTAFDDSLSQVFIGLIEQLTPVHLNMLRIFEDVAAYGEEHKNHIDASITDPAGIFVHFFPNFEKDKVSLFWNDMWNRSFVTATTGELPSLTNHGSEFLKFISEAEI
jgi:hypothetical protein